MKTLRILIVLLVLPISGRAETVCVYEVDTTWYDAGVVVIGGKNMIDGPFGQHGYVDTDAHWILLTDELRAAVWEWLLSYDTTRAMHRRDSVPGIAVDSIIRANDAARAFWRAETAWGNLRVDTLDRGAWSGSPCHCRHSRVDTARIVDTVCPCDHEWEWEWITRADHANYSDPEQTSWELDSDLPGWFHASNVAAWKTGRSRCIYCGAVRTRRDGK